MPASIWWKAWTTKLGFDFDGGNGRDDDTVFGLGYGLNGCLGLKVVIGLGFVAARGGEGAGGGGWAHTRHFHFDPNIGPWLLPWLRWVLGEFGEKKSFFNNIFIECSVK